MNVNHRIANAIGKYGDCLSCRTTLQESQSTLVVQNTQINNPTIPNSKTTTPKPLSTPTCGAGTPRMRVTYCTPSEDAPIPLPMTQCGSSKAAVRLARGYCQARKLSS